MSVSIITPRMHKALRDNKRLVYFADVWTAVLEGICDTQAEWQANSADENMDYTTAEGQARLGIVAGTYSLAQVSDNTNFQLVQLGGGSYVRAMQSVLLTDGRAVDECTVKVDNTGGAAATLTLSIITEPKTEISSYPYRFKFVYTQWCTGSVSVAAGFSGTKTVTFPFTSLPEGTYYILASQAGSAAFYIRYQNTDVYAGGSFSSITRNTYGVEIYETIAAVTGDMYFDLSLSGYNGSGYVTTGNVDLGEVPGGPCIFQAAYEQPAGTTITFTLYGSATGAFGGEETTYNNVQDGQTMGIFQFWRVKAVLTSNTSRNQSPSIDMVSLVYAKSRVRMREKTALRYVDKQLRADYEPILVNAQFQMSELKVIERLASGGSATMQIESPSLGPIHRLIADSPLKNHRGMLYVGADVPGMVEADLLRFFIGVVDTGNYKPRFRRKNSGLSLTFKNPILELTRKVPQVTASGSLDLATNAISYDGEHVLDASLDLMRGEAGIPARYIDVSAILAAKQTIGDDRVVSSGYTVRRSNAAGLVDTRLKSPEEVKKHLAALAQIADGYWVVDEGSRITFVVHDAAAAAEEDWADETLVRAGLKAIPIEDIGDIKLGYDDWLFNACICGAGWDGSGGDWKAFSVVYAGANSDSAADFAPGSAVYWSLMEKNLVDASKWLDNAPGYNGDAIAEALSLRYSARFAYPPLRLMSVVVPMSQFMRTLGSVVTVTSEEVAKFRRRRIAESETVKFMVTKKTYAREKDRMVFDLMELT